MKKRLLYPLLLLSSILTFSCSDNIVSDCQVCTDDSAVGEITTFAAIQQTIFEQNCISCHSGNTPSGGLDLSATVSYNNLVNAESNGSSLKRVEPFNAPASYLVKVLEGNDAPLMPPGMRLSQAKIDSVTSWINRGAPND